MNQLHHNKAVPWWLSSKESACSVGDAGSLPGREDPQQEEIATHASILAWKIPGTEELGRLQSTVLQRVGRDWSNLACNTHAWTVACQAPLSLEFSRQEYKNGLPLFSLGDLTDAVMNPGLMLCRWILYEHWATREAHPELNDAWMIRNDHGPSY